MKGTIKVGLKITTGNLTLATEKVKTAHEELIKATSNLMLALKELEEVEINIEQTEPTFCKVALVGEDLKIQKKG